MTSRSRVVYLSVVSIALFLAPGAASAATFLGVDPKDLGSFAAVVISLVALVATQITTAEKTRREKREELKASIEKLIDLRAELNAKMPMFTTEGEREFFATTQNTRKSIYLEWAERLAHELPYVTPAEWIVLGGEHMFESNFARARKTYESAVHAAKDSSAVTKATSLRQLAYVLMLMGASTWPQGRARYAEAVRLTAGQSDPYSRYTAALTYRNWAEAEFAAGNLSESHARLGDALKEVGGMPIGFDYRGFEARRCAADLMTLSESFFAARDVEAARTTLKEAGDALAGYADPYTFRVQGQVMVRWAQLESALGNRAAAAAWAAKARPLIEAMPPDDPQRAQALTSLGMIVAPSPTISTPNAS